MAFSDLFPIPSIEAAVKPALDPEQLLDLALRLGADAAEVFQTRSLSRPVFFEANRLKQIESAETEGTALRLWHAGRPGLAVAHGPVAAKALVERALALSALNTAEDLTLQPGTGQTYPNLGHGVELQQLIDWGQEVIARIRQACPEAICSAEWLCEAEATHLTNTSGLDYSYVDTTLSAYIAADWVRGNNFLNVSDGQTQRDSLDPQLLADQIVQRLHWAKRNVVASSGRFPILFTAKAADLLWDTLQAALNGKQVLEQASPWSDQIGQQVIHPDLTLYQDPTAGPFSCPFDDEGLPTRAITFIDAGALCLFYADFCTGLQLSSGTTGNGFRPNLNSYPTPGLFNILLQPGTQSLDAMIAGLERGLIIDQMLGGGAGIAGDFSINVDLGFWVENGEIQGRVKDTMVAGNVYTALQSVLAIGSDAAWNGSCFTPSIVVEGLSTIGR